MSCIQLVTPNLDPVIYQSGHALTDWYGWCLAYVQTAFGTGWAGSNATEAWTDHIPDNTKHEDRNIPGGMYVPIYFSGYHGLGHFAIYKDGQVWCTPIEHKPTADVWSSIDEVVQKYGVTYIGWCEQLGGTQIIEYSPDNMVSSSSYFAEPYVRQMVTIRDTYKYDCNRTDFTDRHSNPIEGVAKGFAFDCQQVYTCQDGSRYYVADPQNSGGYYVPDCDAYIPPPPPPIAPPAAPVTVPPAERYTTITTLMTFPTSADAMSSTNGLTTLKSGTYYVWAKNGKAYQLSTDNMHEPTGNWINTLLNVPDKPKPPVVIPIPSKPVLLPSQVKPGTESDTAWRSSYKSFYHDRHSDLYEVKQHLTMLDYSGKRNPVAVQPGDQMNVTGTFLKDGVMFYRTRSGRDEYFTWFYGISLYDDYGNIQIVKVVDTTPKPTLKNILYWVADDVRRWWDIKTKKEQ